MQLGSFPILALPTPARNALTVGDTDSSESANASNTTELSSRTVLPVLQLSIWEEWPGGRNWVPVL